MVAGQPPFLESNPKEASEKIINGTVKFPKWVSVKLRDLIERLLEKDPRERLTTNVKYH